MKKKSLKSFMLLLLLAVGASAVSAQESKVLFHETFGDNSGSAREWKNEYSVKSGIDAVYSGVTSYTITNAKQSKNTVGSTKSGLIGTQNQDASIVIGPLNVADYSNLGLTYQWKAASVKGTYSTKAYYASSADGTYTEVTGSGAGATSFVERSYSLPEAAQVNTLYIKIVWNTSNTQALIDEVELTGVSDSDEPATEVMPSVTFGEGATVEVGKTFTNTITKPSDLTVSYSSSATDIATVDAATGEVTGVAVGTATITATWAKVEGQYLAGSASYAITVTAAQGGEEEPSADVATKDVTFDFTNPKAYGFSEPKSGGSTSVQDNDEIIADGITLKSKTASGATRTCFYYSTTNGASIDLRVYKGSTLEFTAPSGFHITKIAFGAHGNDFGMKQGSNTLTFDKDTKTAEWTGNASSVTFTTTVKTFLYSAVVSLAPYVTIGGAGYTTFVAPCGISIPEGVTAYAVTANNESSVTLTEVTEAAEGDAIVVKAEEGTKLLDYKAAATAAADNLLAASDGSVTGDGASVYVLANGTDGIGFYLLAAGNNVPKGKAYLKATNAKGFLGFGDEDVATGIQNIDLFAIEHPALSDDHSGIYDLQGRRINGQHSKANGQLSKGLYIVGGRKVIVK